MKPRTIITVVIVLAIMIGSRLLFPVEELPEVSVAAEVIGRPGGFPFTNSLLMTLVVDLVLIVLVLLGTSRMAAIPRGLQNVWELAVDTFYNLGVSIDHRNIARMFTLVATIFFFVLFSNFLALVPGVGSIGLCRTHEEALINQSVEIEEAPTAHDADHEEEVHKADIANGTCGTYEHDGVEEAYVLVPLLRSPSADLNTTLMIALVSFLSIEYFGFKALGIGYLGKFFNFKEGPLNFVVGLFELISEFVRILSFSFRLFGNIFAGEVVLAVMAFLVPWLLPLPFYGLEVFVAFMQAFIFAALTMAFINQATTAHHAEDEHGGHVEASPMDNLAH
ncbi:MAG TPA: F0F1 ATP synthase subunit A [Herpetosiphonaceae bacterium]